MCVIPLIELPLSLPLSVFQGQFGSQAVLDDLNATWRNSGSGVIFGQDTFGDRFKAFSDMINAQADAIQNTVLRTVETVFCPNKIQAISCTDDLSSIPACMYIPLLTSPTVRPLFEAGQLSAWGVKPWDLPEEDVVGRLINNGTFDTGADDYDREAPISWTYVSGDPHYELEELNKIRSSRAWVDSFLEEQLGPDGDKFDFTDYPNRMGKIKPVKKEE